MPPNFVSSTLMLSKAEEVERGGSTFHSLVVLYFVELCIMHSGPSQCGIVISSQGPIA